MDKKEYERHLIALKKWNDNRAANEKKAIERFYLLKALLHTKK